MKKKIVIPTWTLLVMILLLASTCVSLVVALTINNLTAEQISLFAGQVSDSDFAIDNISFYRFCLKQQDKNQVNN